MGSVRLAAALASAIAVFGLQAQTFEVASIKPSGPDYQGMFVQGQPGGVRIRGATLKALVATAYNVRVFEIAGAPAWAGADPFDIEARFKESTPAEPSQMRECLKSLLADRFQLTVHNEDREQSVYGLMIARNGPKLGEPMPGVQSVIRGGKNKITGSAVGMAMLAINLANQLGRTVVDKTGLSAKYDFTLEWTSEVGPASDGPSLFTALQEQLGLRLESQKGVVKMVVIDRVEKPSEN